MSSLRILPVVILSTLFLTSCFGSKTSTETPGNTSGVPVNLGAQSASQAAVTEQQRINNLDKLTSDNLDTQTETKDGKKILKDRRLFINNFKSEGVNTAAKLISALERVEKFTKGEGVTLNDSDIIVMITASEDSSWNVCGSFNATKKDLDAKNKYYGYIDKICSPQTK